jgi:hypothetical protein
MQVQIIYSTYQIPQNLQEHMLRVAALAQFITDNWTGNTIDKEDIVIACLFHDIAKPMTFDIAKQEQFGASLQDIQKLTALQNKLKMYAENEHDVTIKIVTEIGCSSKTIQLINNLEWNYLPRLLAENDIESLIPIYSDMRIGPKGILPLSERIADLKKRAPFPGIEEVPITSKQTEASIQKNTSINLQEIPNTVIECKIQELRLKEIID